MNLSEARSLLTQLLDEDGIRRTDDVLDAIINDGYQLAAVMTQACERTTSFTYEAAKHFINAPQAMFVPVSVYNGTTRLEPVRIGDLDSVTEDWINAAAGTPTYYHVMGMLSTQPTIWLHPRPATTVRIRMAYAATPERLISDADILQLPNEHCYVVLHWAYAWELLKERGALFANKAFQVFSKFVQSLNTLQTYVYNRTPDRDWQLMPWDAAAVTKKLHAFQRETQAAQPGVEAQQLAQ